MKKCQKCGGSNSDSEVYCDYCGALLIPNEKNTFFDFLNETQYVFAIWGVFGAFSLYLLDLMGKFSDNNIELLKSINNSTAIQSQFYDFIVNNISACLFSVTATASFVLFLLISIAIIQKWQTYFGNIYVKSIENKKIGTNYIIFIAFQTFFLVVVIAIAAFTVIKFLYVLVQLEYLLIIMIIVYGCLAYLSIRIIQKNDAMKDNKKFFDWSKINLPPNAVYGVGFAIFGLFLTCIILLTLGNNPLFTPLITILASLGTGLYFLGLTILANSYLNQHNNKALVEEIKDLSRKIDELKKG
ncbi:MAG TPA: zinc ribbon domain-containing protein [Methanoregula sp.]|nr:zinc ribbon domain-containing protein [Methanoregula sp.]